MRFFQKDKATRARSTPSFRRLRSFMVYPVLTVFLFTPLGCGYKPSYLMKSERTPIAERWKVTRIDPSRLSPDESSVLKEMGPPQYIRFFRNLSPERQRVYEWIYTDPVRLISFIDGKKTAYAVVDDNPSSLNDDQKNRLFWGGIGTVAAAGLALLYYYLAGNK